MNATILLGVVLEGLGTEQLEAVFIGNAAADVQGAPVTARRAQITPRLSSSATSSSTQRATGHWCVGRTRSGAGGGS